MEKIYNFIFPEDEIEMEIEEIENGLNTKFLNKPFKDFKKITKTISEREIKVLLKVSQIIFKFGCGKYIITFEIPEELEYINRIILTIPIDKSFKGNNLIIRSLEATHYKEYLVNNITINHPNSIINYRDSYCENLCWIRKLSGCNNLCKNCKLKNYKRSNGFLIGDKVCFKSINGKEYKYNGIITGLCNDGTYGIYYERKESFDRFNIERKLTGKLYEGYGEKLCFEVVRNKNDLTLKKEIGISLTKNYSLCKECILDEEYCNDCNNREIENLLKESNIKIL